MFRKFAFASLCMASVVGTGCRDDNNNNVTPVDLSHPVSTDMAGTTPGGNDQGMTFNYMATTPHDIDTGVVPGMTAVKLTGMVVVDTPSSFASSKGTKC